MVDMDLRHVPFSRYQSYFALSWLEGSEQELSPGLWLRNLHGDGVREVFLLLTVQGGKPVAFTPEPSVEELRLRAENGVVRLCIAEPEQLRIRVEGIGLRLTMRPGPFNSAVDLGSGYWRLNAASAFREYTAVPLTGELSIDAPWEVGKCKRVVVDVLAVTRDPQSDSGNYTNIQYARTVVKDIFTIPTPSSSWFDSRPKSWISE